MKDLQSVCKQITKILEKSNTIMDITPPRPYIIKKDDKEWIDIKVENLLKEGKIEEYNEFMEKVKSCKLYFDDAEKYTNLYSNEDKMQETFNKIIKILLENNVTMCISPPRPYIIKDEDRENDNTEVIYFDKTYYVCKNFEKEEEND